MEPKESKYCIYCGKKISADAEKCEHCGEWFEDSSISRNHIPNNYVPQEKIDEEENIGLNGENKIKNDQVDNTNNINTIINSINANDSKKSNIDDIAPNNVGNVNNNINKDNGNVDVNNNTNMGNGNGNVNVNNGNLDNGIIGNSDNIKNSSNIKNASKYSNILPIRRLLLLTIVTGSLYGFYWFYKNNCFLKDDLGKDINPIGRTILLIIPIANIIVFYDLLSYMNKYIEAEGIDSYSPGLNTLIWLFVPFGHIWALVNVQESINELWRIKKPNLPIRREFNNPEIIVIFLGVILWISYYAFIFFIIFMTILNLAVV